MLYATNIFCRQLVQGFVMRSLSASILTSILFLILKMVMIILRQTCLPQRTMLKIFD